MNLQMNKPFFSIIIPAYNAENHIRKLLDSIKQKTFTNYELIVVCDNCTDDTESIAKSYGARTDTVSFGLDGLTRDHGIAMATGSWILFADDDDWFMDDTAFHQIYDVAIHDLCIDLVAFGYMFQSKGYKAPTGHELFTPRIAHVWSKAWRRDTIGDARFGNAVFCSDTYFLKAMNPRVSKIATIDKPLYYYNFLRPGSQTDLFVQGKIRQSPVAQ